MAITWLMVDHVLIMMSVIQNINTCRTIENVL